MNMKSFHTPVMLKEVLECLRPKPGGYYLDATLGGAGYTIEIAKRVGEKGRVLAIDLDELAINQAKLLISNLKLSNIILAHDNFKNLSEIVKEKFKKKQVFSGIVFDLGLSSDQLEDRNRGFSFQLDAPLNMAFGQPAGEKAEIETTEYIVNKYRQAELIGIIREYGEEKNAARIASQIVKFRNLKPIKTTGQLLEIIKKAGPTNYQGGKIHPATKTFQALRIATNHELNNLAVALPQATSLLAPGGKIIIISYHSLEDRLVKIFLKKESKNCLCPPELPICACGHKASLKIINKKVMTPSQEEIKNNRRARSAKMRAAEKIL